VDPRKARQERGWTIYEAAQRMGIHRQSLTDLERAYYEHGSPPSGMTARTMHACIEAYYPDVKISDFFPDTPFEAIPLAGDLADRLLLQGTSQ